VYDSADSLFSGASTVQQAVDRFIATTAPIPDAFDAGAVRRGVATAPVLFSTETICFHPQLGGVANIPLPFSELDCSLLYDKAWKLMGYNDSSGNPSEPGKSIFRFLNSGGYVARVWALKRAFAVYRKVLKIKRLTRQQWKCDQSVWGLVYLWSITQDARMTPDVRIPRGLINLDFHNTFFLLPYITLWGKDFVPWSSTAIADVVAGGRLPFPLFFHMVDKPNATPAILHFNGRGGGTTKTTLWMLRNHTSWYVETKRSAAAFL
ncbi:expression site-associated gene (ESAG-like) protein, partial [Trypanosoma theileri]